MGRPLERCILCDEPTGRAGKGEDSLYVQTAVDDEYGPFCEECYDKQCGSKEG